MIARSPGAAFAWELARRHRWGWLAIVSYFLVLGLVRLFVLVTEDFRLPEDPLTFAFLVTVPLSAAVMYLLAVFSFGLEGDIAGRRSIFPSRRLTLPVSTRSLVFWPMFYGSLAVTTIWIGSRALGIWPDFLDAPVFWPIPLAVATLAWTQALTWMPYPVGWMRVGITVAVLTLIDAVVFTVHEMRAPEWLVVLLLLPLIPLAYLTACFAIGKARRGESPDWSSLLRLPAMLIASAPREHRGFSSAERAQAWFEWRQVGRSLPVMIAIVLPFELAMLFLFHDTPVIVAETLVCIFLTPPFLALFVASSVSGSSLSEDHDGLDAFVAMRPVPGTLLLGAKLKMAMASTVAGWAIVLVATPIALEVSDTWSTAVEGALRTAEIFGPPRAIMIGVLILLTLFAATWKQLVQSLCIGMSGRAWLIKASVFGPLLMLTALGPLVVWVGGIRAIIGSLWTSIPWIVAGLACVKVVAGGWVAIRLHYRRVLGERVLVTGAAIWSVVVLVLHALLAWIVPAILVPGWFLGFTAILAVPLVRIAVSPLALARNRHG